MTETKIKTKPILFSGVQPSGAITIGNYIGAIRNFVLLKDSYRCLFSIVDLHALTVRREPRLLDEGLSSLPRYILPVGWIRKKI